VDETPQNKIQKVIWQKNVKSPLNYFF